MRNAMRVGSQLQLRARSKTRFSGFVVGNTNPQIFMADSRHSDLTEAHMPWLHPDFKRKTAKLGCRFYWMGYDWHKHITSSAA
jgi:hypothetical protein